MAMRKAGIRSSGGSGGASKKLGKFHQQAIARVADVPKAAQGFPNTTPGATDAPVIMKKEQ